MQGNRGQIAEGEETDLVPLISDLVNLTFKLLPNRPADQRCGD